MAKKLFVPCEIRRLPEEIQFSAALEAIKLNPENHPREVTDPGALGALVQKRWGLKGVDLTVSFMEATEQALKERILSHMNAWRDVAGANVRFVLTSSTGMVRLTREGDGYWSNLGTDILRVPAGQPTMCLSRFTMRTPESEFIRVVRHEAGHTLGFTHEHLRRDLVARIDRAKAIAYFAQYQGWDENTTIQQVLTPVEDVALVNPTRADGTSIMAYALPGEIMIDGKPIPGGIDLDELDKQYARQVYPPVQPAHPAEAGGVAVVVLIDSAGKEIARFKR